MHRAVLPALEEIVTPRRIAEILEILNDGKWHLIEEIHVRMHLGENQVQQIVAFLKEYEFVALDRKKKEIRLEDAVRKFLMQTATS